MIGAVGWGAPGNRVAVLPWIFAPIPVETPDVPILCLCHAGSAVKLGDGAARFGRRTPGPHDWLAAPPAFTRGDDRRGAGMDIMALINERRAKLYADAMSGGLEPHDALVYWGDTSLLFEIIESEDRTLDVGKPADLDGFRSLLIGSVLEGLCNGKLRASAPDKQVRNRRRFIPKEFWSDANWYDDEPLLEPASEWSVFRSNIAGLSNVLITGPTWTDIPVAVTATTLLTAQLAGESGVDKGHVEDTPASILNLVDETGNAPLVTAADKEASGLSEPSTQLARKTITRITDEQLIEQMLSTPGLESMKQPEIISLIQKLRPDISRDRATREIKPKLVKQANAQGIKLRGRGRPSNRNDY